MKDKKEERAGWKVCHSADGKTKQYGRNTLEHENNKQNKQIFGHFANLESDQLNNN